MMFKRIIITIIMIYAGFQTVDSQIKPLETDESQLYLNHSYYVSTFISFFSNQSIMQIIDKYGIPINIEISLHANSYSNMNDISFKLKYREFDITNYYISHLDEWQFRELNICLPGLFPVYGIDIGIDSIYLEKVFSNTYKSFYDLLFEEKNGKISKISIYALE